MTVDYAYYLKPSQHSELLLILFLKPTPTFPSSPPSPPYSSVNISQLSE